MFWNIRSKAAGIHLRLTFIVTIVAALSSLAIYMLLLFLLFIGFSNQDKAELDGRLLSYWAVWQYGGIDSVIQNLSSEMSEHGGRPFLLIVQNGLGEILGAVIPGEWEVFRPEEIMVSDIKAKSYITLRNETLPYSLIVAGATMEDESRVLVGLSTQNRQFLISLFLQNYPIAFLAIIVAGLLVGIISSHRLLLPIVSLNKSIDRIIATGELSHRLDVRGTNDQLDGLIGRYNRLLDRVASLISGMKDTFNSVAHDLRTPLTSLRGHAELALSNDNISEKDEALAFTVEQTDHVNNLLSAIMDIVETQHGVVRLSLRSCNLNDLAVQVCDMYDLAAGEKSQKIKLHSDTPVNILGDPVRLRQILGNLIDNAVKYSPEGSVIDVYTGEDSSSGWIEVVDDGPGVPVEERVKIFESLYRGDKSRGSHGLGLGLSIVKALVEAHKGCVEAGSVSGRGARFIVKFPERVKN